MKKILFILISLFLVINTNIYAEEFNMDLINNNDLTIINNFSKQPIKSYERTKENNYGVNKKIEITDKNLPNILNTPFVDSNIKIYDFAGIFTNKEIEDFTIQINNFKKVYNMDFVILTINENYSDEDNTTYATDFYDYNDFGIDDKDYSGILLLRNASSTMPFYNIYTFGKAMVTFKDNDIEYILDGMYNSFVSKYYSYGIDKMFEGLNRYYDKNNLSNYYFNEFGTPILKYRFNPFYYAILPFIITLIIILIKLRKHKTIYLKNTADNYIKDDVKYTKNSDVKISDYTRRHRNSSSSSSSGHSSGGFGSSGRSFGGGSGRHG